MPYRVGQEARSETGEADAPERACRECVWSITYDVLLERRPAGASHVIPRPEGYGTLPWMKGFSHGHYPMLGPYSVWTYRRVVDGEALGSPSARWCRRESTRSSPARRTSGRRT